MNEFPTSVQEPSEDERVRMVDLLIQRATSGLLESEHQEIEHLVSTFDNQEEFDRFEATAAAFDLTLSSTDYEPMPTDVHDRVLFAAGAFFHRPPNQALETESTDVSHAVENATVELSRRGSPNPIRWREVTAIAVTAASIMLLLSGFNPFARNNDVPVASVAEQMDEFIASRPADLVEANWTPVHDSAAGGKVIWSDEKQEGYMLFSGMKINDPDVEQYQLWIFDTDPGQATPTDGGVFDITKSNVSPNGTTIIPIKATVPVDHAVQFAVTVEKTGGVYVSKRENIPVLAKVD